MSRNEQLATSLNMLVGLAVLYTAYFAAPILVPLTLAMLLALTLAPLVRALERGLGIVPALGAGIVVGSFVTVLSIGVVTLSDPAVKFFENAPHQLREIEAKLHLMRQPMDLYQEANEEVEAIANIGEVNDDTLEVKIKTRSYLDSVLAGTPRAFGTMVACLFFLYFLLSAGRRLTVKLTRLAPFGLNEKRMAEIARDVQREVSRYLLTISFLNVMLGLVTTAWLTFLGFENSLLVGVAVTALNFAPYIGAVVSAALIGMYGLLQLDQPTAAMVAVGGFFVLTILEGQLVTPLVLGRQLALSPYILFLGIVVVGWLWGFAGALMAVPLMVCTKIACSQIDELRWIAHLISKEDLSGPQKVAVPNPDVENWSNSGGGQ